MLQHRPVLLTLTMDSSCLSSLSFLWLLCTLQDTSKYSKLVQEDRMITIQDGRKSRARKTSLWKQRCVPSEQESNLRYAGAALILLVGIYKHPRCLKTMAVVSSLETKCINLQLTAIAQIFRVPKKSTTLNIFQPCSTERYTVSKISEWEKKCAKQNCYSHGDLCTLRLLGGMWGCVPRVSSTIPPLRLMPLALGPFLKLVASPSEVLLGRLKAREKPGKMETWDKIQLQITIDVRLYIYNIYIYQCLLTFRKVYVTQKICYESSAVHEFCMACFFGMSICWGL